jgi:hypothetical protein
MFPRSLVLTGAALLALGSVALAHDLWINRGGYRNLAGEWCCGEGDCFVVPGEKVSITASGYVLRELGEVVPFSEAQPSPDGAFWRCRRSDGTRRCFFAPPPST